MLIHLFENVVVGIIEFFSHVFFDIKDEKWKSRILLFIGLLVLFLVLIWIKG